MGVTATHCPYCALQCGIRLTTAPAGVTLAPDAEIPVNRGTLYIKGWTAATLLSHPERLTAPLLRSRTGELYATQARCPHKGGPLADGIVAATTLACPLHEYKFNLCSGKSLGEECKPLKTYPVQISPEGHVLVGLTPQS